MDPPTKVNSMITTFMARESTCGLTRGDMTETGSLIRCRDMECLHGLMVGNTKVSTMMIRNMVMVYSLGLMAGNTLEGGTMASNMALESTTHLRKN